MNVQQVVLWNAYLKMLGKIKGCPNIRHQHKIKQQMLHTVQGAV